MNDFFFTLGLTILIIAVLNYIIGFILTKFFHMSEFRKDKIGYEKFFIILAIILICIEGYIFLIK